MTSSILASKDLAKNRKKWFSQNSINKSKSRLWIRLYIINTSIVIFSDSPKPYRKVRKFTMDWNWQKMVFSRFWRRKVSLLHSEYYSSNCLERYFAFFNFSSHVTSLITQNTFTVILVCLFYVFYMSFIGYFDLLNTMVMIFFWWINFLTHFRNRKSQNSMIS